MTITIENNRKGEDAYEYIFQYSGTEEDWDTAKNSELSIAYAYDENDNGGSESDGGVSWTLKSRLVRRFETKFISKLESFLKVNLRN